MATAAQLRAPVHLWIIGGLATLWGAFGGYVYIMTRMRDTEYLAKMMPGVDPNAFLDWIDGFPIWAHFGWGLGVWCGLIGAILLLLRNRYAVWGMGLSMIGAFLGLGYQIMMAPPPPAGAEGFMFEGMPYVIIVVAVALFAYARAMEKRGVLH